MVHPLDKTFDRMFEQAIGLHDTFNRLNTVKTTFPPHNIVKLDDTSFQIELAVAGFKKDELSLTLKDNVLTVKSNKIEDGVTREYTYKGIATRNFTKEFILAEDVVVEGACIVDGLLIVNLKRIVPENKKERTIDIGGVNKDPDILLG